MPETLSMSSGSFADRVHSAKVQSMLWVYAHWRVEKVYIVHTPSELSDPDRKVGES